jgi:hypothetical protein
VIPRQKGMQTPPHSQQLRAKRKRSNKSKRNPVRSPLIKPDHSKTGCFRISRAQQIRGIKIMESSSGVNKSQFLTTAGAALNFDSFPLHPSIHTYILVIRVELIYQHHGKATDCATAALFALHADLFIIGCCARLGRAE